jgi:hypothetical protein
MRKSELKALILECKRELTEEGKNNYSKRDLDKFKKCFNDFTDAVFAQCAPEEQGPLAAELENVVDQVQNALDEIEAVV